MPSRRPIPPPGRRRSCSPGASPPTRSSRRRTARAIETLVKQAGVAPPDSVVVSVRAERTRGAAVPGSGQRFIVRFHAVRGARRRATLTRALLRHPPRDSAAARWRCASGRTAGGSSSSYHAIGRAGAGGEPRACASWASPTATGSRSCPRIGRSGRSPTSPAWPPAAPTSRSIPRCPPARPSTSCATPAPWPCWSRRRPSSRRCLAIRDRLPALRHVIAFDADARGPERALVRRAAGLRPFGRGPASRLARRTRWPPRPTISPP